MLYYYTFLGNYSKIFTLLYQMFVISLRFQTNDLIIILNHLNYETSTK